MYRTIRLFLCAASMVLPALAHAQSPIPEIAYKKFVLPNGLTVLVHEDHKAPIVAVNVWYHVGSKNENRARTGFAHLFEHLMFNGSENYNDDYFKALEPIGATDLNGTTNEDRTNYFQNVPVSALDRCSGSSRTAWATCWAPSTRPGSTSSAAWCRTRSARARTSRTGRLDHDRREHLPQGHPYSWTVIGSMEDLNAASLEDVKEWFRTYYGASNAVLVIAGDIDADEVAQRVERYFGDIPPGPPVIKHEKWIAKMSGEQRQVMQDRVPQARLYKVWNVPAYGDRGPDLHLAGARRPRRAAGRRASTSGSSTRTDRDRRRGVLGRPRDREPVPRRGHGAARRRPKAVERGRRGDRGVPREGPTPRSWSA